ncbi:MAG: TetR/AcrR family transcriptional regulator [Nitrospiraceae bacterium]|nr:TetR/AcrR family transcriptional regulator [Nitrospiraceae bacterium]
MAEATGIRTERAGGSARARIIAAARRRFFAQGFRGTTMDGLAEELGISKKTIYSRFPGKASLIKAVLLDKFKEVEADLDRAVSEGPRGDFFTSLEALLACQQRHSEEIRPPFLRDIRLEAPEMLELVEKWRRGLVRLFMGRLLGEGRRAGIIRKDVPAGLAIDIILGAMQAVMDPERMEELGLTRKTGFSCVIRVVLDGLITEKGRAIRRGP